MQETFSQQPGGKGIGKSVESDSGKLSSSLRYSSLIGASHSDNSYVAGGFFPAAKRERNFLESGEPFRATKYVTKVRFWRTNCVSGEVRLAGITEDDQHDTQASTQSDQRPEK